MSIQYCRSCHGSGELLQLCITDKADPHFPLRYLTETVMATCPDCAGAGKWRPKGEIWTALEDLPRYLLIEMARIRPWMNIDKKIGIVRFIEGPGIPENDVSMLELLKIISKIGPILEENNWLVKY